MKSKLLHDEKGMKTYAIVFDKRDEVREGLLEFAKTNRFADAHLTGIGAFSEVTLGFFDPLQKEYKKIPITEQLYRKYRTEGRQAQTPCARSREQGRWHGPRRPLSRRAGVADAGDYALRTARAFAAAR